MADGEGWRKVRAEGYPALTGSATLLELGTQPAHGAVGFLAGAFGVERDQADLLQGLPAGPLAGERSPAAVARCRPGGCSCPRLSPQYIYRNPDLV